ncbi:MAG: NBR1-Ig-like domain-containing protein [Chloroflexota bacterium]|nr:NBR1-Ig-like domain-containing protein [Chloroflexota bacterium]
MKRLFVVISSGLVFVIALSGCNFPGRETPTSQVDALNTAAAQTVQAQQTSIAQTAQATKQEQEPEPTQTTSPVPSEEPGSPTATLAPTSTPTKAPTQTPKVACNQAGFVAETIPDGTDFDPGEEFTKTWTLENTGSCTWNANYDVVFVEGDAMGAPASIPLTSGTVKPGETVKISMDFNAPIAAGTHRGDFKLRDQDGVLFGIGENDGNFWVKIDVEGTVYDFTKNYCASGVVWSSGAGTLPCPGSSGDSAGWVRKIDEPILENGVKDDEPGLQVHPQMVNDGWIRGTYPEVSVTEGVYFYVIVGCYSDSNCDVKFKLNYKIDGGAERTLGTWHEVRDDDFNRIKVDLDDLAGEDVQFILLVEANGSASNDLALWFGPRIEP